MNSIVALPLIGTPLCTSAASNSDAELLALGREFDALVDRYNAALRHSSELNIICCDGMPPKPETLLRKSKDGRGFFFVGGNDSEYFSEESVNYFRSAPSIPNPTWGDRAAAARIVEAYDGWVGECQKLRAASGLTAVEELEETAIRRSQ